MGEICAVCMLASADKGLACPDCGWRSSGTAEELQAASKAYDAVVAARLDPLHGRDSVPIRGGRPDDDQWLHAVSAAERPVDSPTDLSSRLRELAEDVTGLERVTVIELDDNGIVVTLIGITPQRVLHFRRFPLIPWEELAPSLRHPDPDVVRTRLAGGFTAVDREAVSAELRRHLQARIRTADRTVLVSVRPSWPVLADALGVLQKLWPEAEVFTLPGGDMASIIRTAVNAAPLRRALQLVLAEVHPRTWRVRHVAHELFEVDSRVGDQRTFTIDCTSPDRDGTVFALVLWSSERGFVPLQLSTALLGLGHHNVRVELTGHTEVRFHSPSGMSAEPRMWSEILEVQPQELPPPAAGYDLVCLIERAGQGFAARRSLVEQVISLVGAEIPGRLTVSVIGYGDHTYGRGEGKPQEVCEPKVWRAKPERALNSVLAMTGLPGSSMPVAPLEDALALVAGQVALPPGRRMMLLTVGERPPHPSQPGVAADRLPCHFNLEWQSSLKKIRGHRDLVQLAVIDLVEGVDLDPAWRVIGRDGVRPLSGADALSIAHDLGVFAAPSLSFPELVTPKRGTQ